MLMRQTDKIDSEACVETQSDQKPCHQESGQFYTQTWIPLPTYSILKTGSSQIPFKFKIRIG